MELELKRGGRTARVETLGGELVSYRDERGLEYIWGGDPAYWPGRNPLLFPIVGTLKEGKIRFDGREYAMERHGFARRREFTPAARGEDWVRLELRESAETLALYPYPFRLAVEQRLTDTGFSTAVTVANPGRAVALLPGGPHRLPLSPGGGGAVRGLRAGVPRAGELSHPAAAGRIAGPAGGPALPGGHRHPAPGLPLV
ncbi:MAG: hypothetical protein ACLUES_01505 [Flavonifractor plautii]